MILWTWEYICIYIYICMCVCVFVTIYVISGFVQNCGFTTNIYIWYDIYIYIYGVYIYDIYIYIWIYDIYIYIYIYVCMYTWYTYMIYIYICIIYIYISYIYIYIIYIYIYHIIYIYIIYDTYNVTISIGEIMFNHTIQFWGASHGLPIFRQTRPYGFHVPCQCQIWSRIPYWISCKFTSPQFLQKNCFHPAFRCFQIGVCSYCRTALQKSCFPRIICSFCIIHRYT